MNSQRILLIGGLILFMSGLIYGAVYQAFLLTAQQHSILYNLDMALNMSVKGDFEAASAFAVQYQLETAAHEIHRRIPVELMLTGLLAAPLLFVSRYIETSERMQRIFALLVILGSFILASGDIITLYGPERWGALITLGGYSWIGFGLLGYTIYLALYMWLHDTPKTDRRRQPGNRA